MASVDDLTKVVERIEHAVEVGTSPGVRRIDSIRVREIVEGALMKREKELLEEQIRVQRGLHAQVKAGIIVGIVLLLAGLVLGYVTGRAPGRAGAPSTQTHP